MLAAVTTFAEIPARTVFQFDLGGCEYVKVDAATYQLLDANRRPVPRMTYRLADRGGQNDPVYLPRKAA